MSQSTLALIREFMKSNGLAAYIVPSSDPHQSEYVPEYLRRRAYVSGFTGSAGDLVITTKAAGLWTDSRYYLQAETQLQGTGIELFKAGLPETPQMSTHLVAALTEGDSVGVDPMLFSQKAYASLSRRLSNAGITLCSIEKNPVDAVWPHRPAPPAGPVVPYPERYTGESLSARLERVRQEMRRLGAEVLPVTTLDALAWVFNIRGSDVQYNPVVIGYGVIESDRAVLFVDAKKMTAETTRHLSENVDILDYSRFGPYLENIAKRGTQVLVDADTLSRWAFERLQGKCTLVLHRSPITALKARKNDVEIEGIIRAHIRDGVAVTRFLAWLDKATQSETVTEISAAQKLEEFRCAETNYKGPSFGTISAFGAHGAIVHYEADESTDARIEAPGLYLVDSGGQYLDGTTDITRTVALGTPTDEMKDRFTRVLKGNLNLAVMSFPVGTTGSSLDTVARKPLWDIGLNYGHGTGHGVGAYLNVHEGPQAISYYRGMDVPLAVGMVVSDEPGYYKEGAYGIRIENLVYVVSDEELSKGGSPFLRFEILTLCPIDRRLILPELLCDSELAFLNAYHRRVLETLAPLLDDADREWLKQAAAEISR